MSKIYWEVLVAYEDNTWENEVFEKPEGVKESEVNEWFMDGPGKTAQYENAVLAALYYEMDPRESQEWQESLANP